jgi:hypothetical protein
VSRSVSERARHLISIRFAIGTNWFNHASRKNALNRQRTAHESVVRPANTALIEHTIPHRLYGWKKICAK